MLNLLISLFSKEKSTPSQYLVFIVMNFGSLLKNKELGSYLNLGTKKTLLETIRELLNLL